MIKNIVRNSVFGSAALASLAITTGAQAATADDTFDVTLEITATCSVAADSDADLGSVDSTATGLSTSTTFDVNCSKTVPYYIGLAPSNGATNGAGTMTSATTSDNVPYQLRSSGGSTGTIWGDTATSTTVGNGVDGTGTGADQTLTVHVTAADANYAPGVYNDTVTVTVNY